MKIVNFDRFKAPSLEDEPKPVFKCSFCGEPIKEGELYYKIANMKLCENCIADSSEYAKKD